jgi:hypothetical protein
MLSVEPELRAKMVVAAGNRALCLSVGQPSEVVATRQCYDIFS